MLFRAALLVFIIVSSTEATIFSAPDGLYVVGVGGNVVVDGVNWTQQLASLMQRIGGAEARLAALESTIGMIAGQAQTPTVSSRLSALENSTGVTAGVSLSGTALLPTRLLALESSIGVTQGIAFSGNAVIPSRLSALENSTGVTQGIALTGTSVIPTRLSALESSSGVTQGIALSGNAVIPSRLSALESSTGVTQGIALTGTSLIPTRLSALETNINSTQGGILTTSVAAQLASLKATQGYRTIISVPTITTSTSGCSSNSSTFTLQGTSALADTPVLTLIQCSASGYTSVQTSGAGINVKFNLYQASGTKATTSTYDVAATLSERGTSPSTDVVLVSGSGTVNVTSSGAYYLSALWTNDDNDSCAQMDSQHGVDYAHCFVLQL